MSSTPPLLGSPPEIAAAVSYFELALAVLLDPSTSHAAFSNELTRLLVARYDQHWDSADPEKGSAFRSLTRAGPVLDTLLVQALNHAGVKNTKLAGEALKKAMQGSERWTMWIDPGCVSIRFAGDGPNLGGTMFDVASSTATSVHGIQEIWGTLPARVRAQATPTPGHRKLERAKSAALLREQNNRTVVDDERVSAEFEDLVHNVANVTLSPAARKTPPTPARSNKAIAIVKPDMKPGSAAATPQRPLPLHFTIQESTSPYVPNFSGLAAQNATARVPTPLSSSPATTPDADPFARPSSRASNDSSSTCSDGQADVCSIFSHTSNDSRSSSTGSFTSSAPSLLSKCSSSSVPKASPDEMTAAAKWQFPGSVSAASMATSSSAANLAAPGSSLLTSALTAHARSAPSSPSKRRGGRNHTHTLSTSSATSMMSATSSTAGSGHTRGRSSQSHIRVSTAAQVVQDYSNGKVGVLGGGVLLGMGGARPKPSTTPAGSPSEEKLNPVSALLADTEPKQRPAHRKNHSSSGSIATRPASAQGQHQRQRSKSRTPSANGSISAAMYGAPVQHAGQFWQFPYAAQQGAPAPPMPANWQAMVQQGQAQAMQHRQSSY